MPRQKMLTKAITDRIPALYAQDGKGDEAIVYAKWFCPWNNWRFFATELNQETNIAYGLVMGDETELGYFDLNELEEIRGSGMFASLFIERDIHFTPTTLAKVKERYG